jgi:hypothetical protein
VGLAGVSNFDHPHGAQIIGGMAGGYFCDKCGDKRVEKPTDQCSSCRKSTRHVNVGSKGSTDADSVARQQARNALKNARAKSNGNRARWNAVHNPKNNARTQESGQTHLKTMLATLAAACYVFLFSMPVENEVDEGAFTRALQKESESTLTMDGKSQVAMIRRSNGKKLTGGDLQKEFKWIVEELPGCRTRRVSNKLKKLFTGHSTEPTRVSTCT